MDDPKTVEKPDKGSENKKLDDKKLDDKKPEIRMPDDSKSHVKKSFKPEVSKRVDVKKMYDVKPEVKTHFTPQIKTEDRRMNSISHAFEGCQYFI